MQLSTDADDLSKGQTSTVCLRRPWKRYIVVTLAVLTLLIVASLVGSQPSRHQESHGSFYGPPASPVLGWLHTDGTSLVDASGRTVILAGVDDSRLVYGEGNTLDRCGRRWSEASAADIANMRSMGFNMDRIALSWADLEPVAPTVNPNGTLTHHWNEQYLSALSREIKELHAHHMVAILDMHQSGWSPAFTGNACEGDGMPRWLYTSLPNGPNAIGVAQCQFFSNIKETGVPEKPQEGLAAVWHMLARRYASNATVVGADMFNEPDWPGYCRDAHLASFYEKIGYAIRAVNKHILLMYEDRAYVENPSHPFLLARKPALSNAVYSWHFYPTNWRDGQAALAAHLARARAWDVPLWIGEFDGFGGSFNVRISPPLDPHWQSDLGALMAYFKANGISWSIWDYKGGGYSVVEPGTDRPKGELISLLHQDMP